MNDHPSTKRATALAEQTPWFNQLADACHRAMLRYLEGLPFDLDACIYQSQSATGTTVHLGRVGDMWEGPDRVLYEISTGGAPFGAWTPQNYATAHSTAEDFAHQIIAVHLPWSEYEMFPPSRPEAGHVYADMPLFDANCKPFLDYVQAFYGDINLRRARQPVQAASKAWWHDYCVYWNLIQGDDEQC
jgi:hypothetical protein